ncbi:hypothetical protein FRC10_009394 [Ceratobasidium sp. 414]|nr:hypothetical protein FRC10_009394 [Ceratobasidium sp. 414]
MILNDISASIHTPEGEKLPEYETKQVDGAGFPQQKERTLKYGIKHPHMYNLASLSGAYLNWMDKCKGQVTNHSSIRLFSFGKRILTDREDIASTKGSQQDLNVIRVTLRWGIAGMSTPQTQFTTPKENGPIHEKAAKKGHTGSAGLGNTTSINYSPRLGLFAPDTGIGPLVFVFCYAPEDWLQARGIVPSKTPSSRKRDRDTTPDVIDIDDLETDDDDDVVVVKHLVPAPAESSGKRRRIKDENDAKPKLES